MTKQKRAYDILCARTVIVEFIKECINRRPECICQSNSKYVFRNISLITMLFSRKTAPLIIRKAGTAHRRPLLYWLLQPLWSRKAYFLEA